ncbi:hypothetical protein GCM10007383_10920 [Arenibacter certesii]|uniref:Uncharacterized protein n=2 Tax=Arenibacter certesii TaxID=228955 RepID=A0A918MJC1_9FLAO|nr:hypothetical protein GCM10007383_10920 [Arenibacter certesii]
MANGVDTRPLLEEQYHNFMEKAANIKYTDSRLAEFFERKATKIDKILKDLSQ